MRRIVIGAAGVEVKAVLNESKTGVTPASRGDEPRAASPVNVFGKVEGDATVLRKVKDGADVVISACPG